MVPSHDGQEIPMNVYCKKGVILNRQNKTLIESYGAYGISGTQDFSIAHISAMEKGWVLA